MKEPAFWEEYIKDLPVCKEFRSRYREVREELEQFVSNGGAPYLINYPNIKINDPERPGEMKKLYEGDQTWKVTVVGVQPDEEMTAFGGKFIDEYVQKKFGLTIREGVSMIGQMLPVIGEITQQLESEGHLCNAFVSIMSPGTKVAAHKGGENLMRIHLGLICDPGCVITVGDEQRSWKEGELIAFKDAGPYPHSVKHDGTRDRWILSFDLKLDYLRTVIDHPMI